MTSLFDAVKTCLTGPVGENAPGTLEAHFVFPEDFIGFAGHFPGNPVLPGIAQIMAAAQTASRGVRFELRSVERCKFLRPVKPLEPVAVRATVTEHPGGALSVDAKLDASGDPCAVMRLSLTPPQTGTP